MVQGSEPAKGKQISERSRVWNYSQLKSRLLRLPTPPGGTAQFIELWLGLIALSFIGR